MILEQTGTLAPSNEPWKLIRDAIHDLELQEQTKGVQIYMGTWHDYSRVDQVCYQCLAGCSISRRLGVGTKVSVDLYDLGTVNRKKLLALDYFRLGEIYDAFKRLQLQWSVDMIPDCIDIPIYSSKNSGLFKQSMLDMADMLEKAYNGQPVPFIEGITE